MLLMQTYFDRAVRHLHGMRRPAMQGGGCVYLAEDGSKCVVGAFIPDGHEAQRAAGSVEVLADKYPDLVGVAWPDHFGGVALATALQAAHDNRSNWSNRSGDGRYSNCELLVEIARRYNLDPTEVTSRSWNGRRFIGHD